MFKKGDKADYAYVVLFGTVLFLNVKSTTYLPGQEPQTPPELKQNGKQSVNPELLKK